MFVPFLYILKVCEPWNLKVTGLDIVQTGSDWFGTIAARFSGLLNFLLITLRKNRTPAACSHFVRSHFRITHLISTVLWLV